MAHVVERLGERGSRRGGRRKQGRGQRLSLRKRGLSLIEVMFAIGVVMIGLLGIAVLVPIAGQAARDGINFDRASRLGLNSVREFQMREMGRPDNWLRPDGTAVGVPNTNAVGYCIDPRFVAVNNAFPMAPIDPRRFFPYSAPLWVPRFERITLRNWSATLSSSGIMGSAAADEVFVSGDDLDINAPQDPQLPAEQIYFNQNAAAPNKRSSKGAFSWLATISPQSDAWSLGGATKQVNYTLSIVVLQGRDSSMSMDAVNERWAIIPYTTSGATITANGFYSGGIAGGDVLLCDKTLAYTLSGAPSPPAPAPEDLVVKRGQWIMLIRGSAAGPVSRWYKVTEADPDELGTTTSSELAGTSPPSGHAARHVSLFGQDWQIDPANQTYACIMPGVVAVYEKTIRLESSSLWTQ
jgi:hypothetical protein